MSFVYSLGYCRRQPSFIFSLRVINFANPLFESFVESFGYFKSFLFCITGPECDRSL